MGRTRRALGGYSRAYTGGLWIERANGESGDPAMAPPAMDWLVLMALPVLPVREVARPDVAHYELMGSAVGWHLACSARWHHTWRQDKIIRRAAYDHPVVPYARWQLWSAPLPVTSLATFLGAAGYVRWATGWHAARRRHRKAASDQPLMQTLELAGIRDHESLVQGLSDPWMQAA